MPCGIHSACDDCMSVYLESHADASTAGCPCGAGPALDLRRDITYEQLCRIVASRGSGARARSSTGGHVEEELLNETCPRCGAAFFDFDGCAALMCGACKQAFCALCCEQCEDMRACHAHVLSCQYNPHRGTSYFLTIDEWRAVRSASMQTRVTNHLRSVFFQDGMVCALASFVKMKRLGVDIAISTHVFNALHLYRFIPLRTLCTLVRHFHCFTFTFATCAGIVY